MLGYLRFMRILAYAMLISGFFWVCFCQFEIHGLERAALSAQFDKIPKQQSYKPEDIEHAVSETIQTYGQHLPSFYVGALLMLGGGIVLDVAGRRKRELR